MGVVNKYSERLKVAVIGVGHLGQHHARIYASLKNDVELVGIVDVDRSRAKSIGRKTRSEWFTDYRDLFDKQLDAVAIAVPTQEHFRVATDFIKQGVHVFIEKPIATSLEEADQLIELAEKHAVSIQVGHVERFNPAILKLMQIIDKPKFIEVHRLAPYNPRGTDVSVVLDLMIHDLDIVSFLVNKPISRIDAIGVEVLTPQEDIANVRITFEDGCVANISTSRISLKEMRKIRIFQPYTYISLDYRNQEGVIYFKRDDRIDREVLDLKKGEPLKLEIQSFVESIVCNKPPRVSAQQGRDVLAVAIEIERQIQEKKKVLAE